MGKKIIFFASIFFFLFFKNAYSESSWPYKLYRANLHAHSNISNQGKDASIIEQETVLLDPRKYADYYDHAVAASPEETCKTARSLQLDVIGFSEHDLALSASAWNNLGRICSGYNSSPIALRGFERTGGDYQHINIFGSSNFITAASTFKGYGVTGMNGKVAFASDLKSLYEWIIEQGKNDPYLVCQFNHPSRSKSLFDHFKIPTGCEAVKDYITLFEIRSGPNGINTDIEAEEKNLHEAIRQGILPGVTIGIDNFSFLTASARKFHTGVWVDESITGTPKEKILSALLQRRTFASESKNFVLKYWAKLEGNSEIYYLGDKMNFPRGKQITFFVELGDDEPIGEIQIAEVRKDGASYSDFDGKNPSVSGNHYSGSKTIMPTQNTLAYYIKIKQKNGDLIISSPIGTEVTLPKVQEYHRPNPQNEDIIEALRGYFTFEIILCKGVKNGNFGAEPVGETNIFYSGRDKMIMLLKTANLDRKYTYPCLVKTLLYDPSGRVIKVNKFSVDRNNAEKGLWKMGENKLTFPGIYTVEGYVNGELHVRKTFKLIK